MNKIMQILTVIGYREIKCDEIRKQMCAVGDSLLSTEGNMFVLQLFILWATPSNKMSLDYTPSVRYLCFSPFGK